METVLAASFHYIIQCKTGLLIESLDKDSQNWICLCLASTRGKGDLLAIDLHHATLIEPVFRDPRTAQQRRYRLFDVRTTGREKNEDHQGDPDRSSYDDPVCHEVFHQSSNAPSVTFLTVP